MSYTHPQIDYPLLTAADPPPVEVLRREGSSPYFFTVEHAGKIFPKQLATLGLSGVDLERHITWDVGAAALTRLLSQQFNATSVLQTYSRLVVDCNRWTSADDFVTRRSETTDIPGNDNLDPREIAARTDEIYWPYHRTITQLLDERVKAKRTTILIAVHTCTDIFHGVRRPWHIGVLYEHDKRLAGILLNLLRQNDSLVVGDNEPYYMTDKKDYSVPVHGERRGLLHAEFEVRQDLVGEPEGQDQWAGILFDLLTRALRVVEREFPTGS